MNKAEAIKFLIDEVYSKDLYAVLTKREIKTIEKCHKENFKQFEEYSDFKRAFPDVDELVGKIKAGKSEIDKQLEINKDLQSGMINECCNLQTLANHLKLNCFIDLDTTPVNKLPKEIKAMLIASPQSARYVYYKKTNQDIYIVQYGNPDAGDAVIVVKGNQIRVEIKDLPARTGEKDIFFDDNGKLVPSEDVRVNCKGITAVIEHFNNDDFNITKIFSHNIPIPPELSIMIVEDYFNLTEVDLFMTTDKDNKLVVIKPEDLLDVNKNVLSLAGSEIRPKGKNKTKVYTPKFLLESLKVCSAEEIAPRVFRIINRGDDISGPITRKSNDWFGFNHVFRIENKYINGNPGLDGVGTPVDFCIDDVKELKPTVCAHINLNLSKNELKQIYKNK